MFEVEDDAPQGFDDKVLELDALLQSMPPLVFWLLYDGVVVGAIALFMLIVGRACCDGAANEGLPMPGLLGAIAGNDVFRPPNVLSGLMARVCAFGAFKDMLFCGGGDTGGVDHENVAAGDALLDDRERFADA
jgi:hypothetical protein